MSFRIFIATLVAASFGFAQQPTTQQPKEDRKEPSNQRGNTTNGQTGQSSATVKSSPSGSSLSSADRKFLEKAAEGGRMEVELGQLAAQRASDQQVKSFGEMMVRDHGKANMELEALAKEKGLNLTPGKEPSHKDKLSKLSGAEFDKAYMKEMVEDHKKDVAEFQKQSRSASSPEVRSFAAKTLPTLQMHLDRAQMIQSNKGTADRSAPQGRANTERTGAQGQDKNQPPPTR